MVGGKRDIVKKSCLTILPLWSLANSGYNPIIVPDNATIGAILNRTASSFLYGFMGGKTDLVDSSAPNVHITDDG
jgi:hypothetical protein